MTAFFGARGLRAMTILAVCSVVPSCNSDLNLSPGPPPEAWSWTDLGGPAALASPYVSNHEPLVIVDGALFLGTADGVWKRPPNGGSWQRAGLDGKMIHALVLTKDEDRMLAAGFDPEDDAAPTAWYSTDSGASWTPAASWPRGEPGSPEAGISFPFYALEPDPVDNDVAYGNLDGDTLAVTADGGATWLMVNGATSPTFAYACVPFRPADAAVLIHGCEIPLDFAWIGARRVVDDSPWQLPDFRYLYAFPDDEELANRRINAIAAPANRDDRLFVGVEGGLVQLTSASGDWTGRADVDADWLFRAEDGEDDSPYAYIRALAVLDGDGRHLLFGGPLNGDNDEPLLFETTNGGGTVWQHEPKLEFDDPRVEQALAISANEVLLVISEADDDQDAQKRRERVVHLERT